MKVATLVMGLLLTLPAAAEEPSIARSGAWKVWTYSDRVLVSTESDDGLALTMICSLEKDDCRWGIIMGPHGCEEDATVNLLVNGAAGSLSTPATCVKSDEELSSMDLSNFDGMVHVAAGSPYLDFAVPMADTIAIHRFATAGYTSAAKKVLAAAK